MALTVIALGLAKRPPEDKAALGTDIWNSTKTKPEFTAASPTPAELKTAIDGVTGQVTLIAATQAALDAATLGMPDKTAILDDVLGRYASFAESKSKDKAVLAGWSFPVRAERSPVGQLPAPGDLQVSQGDMASSLEPHWDPVRGATAYIVDIAESADGPWTQKYVGTKANCIITGLVSGKEYWLRVCAVGAAGPSDWSDRASKRAS